MARVVCEGSVTGWQDIPSKYRTEPPNPPKFDSESLFPSQSPQGRLPGPCACSLFPPFPISPQYRVLTPSTDSLFRLHPPRYPPQCWPQWMRWWIHSLHHMCGSSLDHTILFLRSQSELNHFSLITLALKKHELTHQCQYLVLQHTRGRDRWRWWKEGKSEGSWGRSIMLEGGTLGDGSKTNPGQLEKSTRAIDGSMGGWD